MVLTREMSRQIALEISNAVPFVDDETPIAPTAPTVVSRIDGQVIEKYDIVWIKHVKCSDTPVIVQDIFNGE